MRQHTRWLTLTFKMLSSWMSAYLSDLIQPAVPVRHLQSFDILLLRVLRTQIEFAWRTFMTGLCTHLELTAVWRLDLVYSQQNNISKNPVVQMLLTWSHQCLCIHVLTLRCYVNTALLLAACCRWSAACFCTVLYWFMPSKWHVRWSVLSDSN